ncbi:MAG: flagellar hook protein FlgE [Micavibrio sp.]|nr:flagellar hook protein FlgE [Micavibrio sp.]|tara:strand:+ start:1665 stop:3008 length:1344 start_codon:yes stop_codon:yes gene_type:complete
MSLNSALNAAVSGLKAQSAALAAVSENIANASTTAYKTREISFQSLVTNKNIASSTNQVGGVVTYKTSQAMTEQGSIEITGVTENIAIEGQGFFVVTDDVSNQPSGYTYTRNGNFSTNEDGLLINDENMILLGQATDENGVVTAANKNDLNSLEPIDVNSIGGTAEETTTVNFDMNLPADANIADTFTTAFELFDELGVSHTIEVVWTKTAVNTWTADYSDPYQTADGATSPASATIDVDTGTAGVQSQLTYVFNGDGSLNTINGVAAAAFDIDVTGFATSLNPTGANDLTFSMNMGTQNNYDGLTQFSSDEDTPDISDLTIEQDGVRYGQLSGVEIDDEGIVTAVFDNGVRNAIYQIPIATFSNPQGLTNIQGTVYDENERAGNLILGLPGEGNAGTIQPTALEQSTTDTSTEFNKMIISQQAYSSAAQVLSTVDEMFDSLLSAVR